VLLAQVNAKLAQMENVKNAMKEKYSTLMLVLAELLALLTSSSI
jgi:hypothetical protein